MPQAARAAVTLPFVTASVGWSFHQEESVQK